MRDIKFRFWEEKSKTMIDWLCVRQTVLNRGDTHMMYDMMGSNPDIVKMQFTGLTDKNGKEIYEGDICEQLTPNHTKIKMLCRWGTFQRTMDTGWTVDISGFCFERSDGLMALPIVKNWMGKHDLETLEVIGNIYEHSHLLNK